MNKTYASKWNTWVGVDCIDLHSALAHWLGERLIHLGEHTNNIPMPYTSKFPGDDDAAFAAWKADLTANGKVLLAFVRTNPKTLSAAQEAMHWVADNLGLLWD